MLDNHDRIVIRAYTEKQLNNSKCALDRINQILIKSGISKVLSSNPPNSVVIHSEDAKELLEEFRRIRFEIDSMKNYIDAL